MTNRPKTTRIDSASRIIVATPRAIFRAFLDPEVVVSWRRPTGFDAEILSFDPRTGGGYRMIYRVAMVSERDGGDREERVICGQFVELAPDEHIVEEMEFEGAIPELAGMMRMTTTLTPVTGGTKVALVCENVPSGLVAEDHQRDLASLLKNLAVFIE